MANEKGTKLRKAASILLSVLTYLFFAVCVLSLMLSVLAKRDVDGAVSIGGWQMRVVVSDSMASCPETDVSGYSIGSIPIRSMVFIELVPTDEKEANDWYASLRVGDVLTFRYVYVTQETITHRITSITPKESGGYIIELEGDNKASDADTLSQTIDTSLTDSPNYVIGRVTSQSYPLGFLVTALKSPVGIVCIVIIPCVIIAIFEIFRLVGALTENRRKREREEQQRRDEEFEEMKRQLELLQKQNQANTASVTPTVERETENTEELAENTEE